MRTTLREERRQKQGDGVTEEANTGGSWDDYYRAHNARPPHALLLEALELSGPPTKEPRHAVDLGCGGGNEARHLLLTGWHVLAIDAEQDAIDRLEAGTPEDHRPRLSARVALFQELTLPKADLIHSAFSMPFCPPEHFARFWETVRSSLEPGGRFVGQFFGPRDTWASEPDMTFHSREQVESLLDRLEVEKLVEEEHDRPAFSGPKHWHIFHVIARNPNG